MRDLPAESEGELVLAAAAVVLSVVAGYVDALGWALFSHVYVANMTGNTVALGRGLAQADLTEAAARIWPIAVFTFGLFASELIYELVRRRGQRSSIAWTLGLELLTLVAVALLPWPGASSKDGTPYFVATGLLALAMGLQNATLVRVGASSVYTTHLTGNLTRLARESAHALMWLEDPAAERASGRAARQRSTRRVLLMTAMWVAYAIAAILGALAAVRWNRRGTLAAAAVLATLVAYDFARPMGGHETPPEANPIF